MSVTMHAPEHYATMEETLAMKLNLHSMAVATLLTYTRQIKMSKTFDGIFVFPSHANVKALQGNNQDEFTVKLDRLSIKYCLNYFNYQVSSYTIYNELGEAIDPTIEIMQSSYESLISYCTEIMLGILEPVPAEEVVVETN